MQISIMDVEFIKDWLNCEECSMTVSADGIDVWVSGPVTGHWLSEDDKAKFVAWKAAQ